MLSFTTTVAFAQGYGQMPDIPQMKEVSGQYSNNDVGVKITFPSGWSGIEMETPQGTMATVSKDGMSAGASSQIMNLVMSEKAKVNEPPTDPTQGKSKCDTPTVKSITVSGAQGTETVMICTDDDGNKSKAKIVSAETKTHWIAVMFMSPLSEFDSGVGKFDDSIKTLSIQNVVASVNQPDTTPDTTEQPAQLESRNVPVSVGGKNVDVLLQSSSSITKFGLDEQNKKISFTANGDKAGTTRLSLGNVLKGPFVVMMDDQVTQDFTTDDQGQTLEMTYSSGNHDISISGTQVVPEFPIAVVGVIAAVVGMVVIVGRTRLFGNLKY